MILIDGDVTRFIELIETIPLSIPTSYNYSILIFHFPSSHFMLLVVRNIQISIIIHGQTRTGNVRNDSFSTSTISTRPSYHSTVTIIGNDETITFFIDN